MRRLTLLGVVLAMAYRSRRRSVVPGNGSGAPPAVAGDPHNSPPSKRRVRTFLALLLVGLVGSTTFLVLLIATTFPSLLSDRVPGFRKLPHGLQAPWYQVGLVAMGLITAAIIVVSTAVRFGLLANKYARLTVVAVALMSGATLLLVDSSFSETWSGHFLGFNFVEVSRVGLIFLVLVTFGSFLWASEATNKGSKSELGAAVLSGAVISLVLFIIQPGQPRQPDESDARTSVVKTTLALSYVDARGLSLQDAQLSRRNFLGADLSDSNLSRAVLWKTSFESADLARTTFDGARLIDANLRHAYLKSSSFKGADLRGADFRFATLPTYSSRGKELFDYSKFAGAVTDVRKTHWPAGFSPQKIPQLCKAPAFEGDLTAYVESGEVLCYEILP